MRSRYRIYRGSEEGWTNCSPASSPASARRPAGFVKSIPHALTPPEAALQVIEDHDPASLSFADWALVLRHRDATPANKTAAEKVWKVITDKQQGGSTRLKIPVKVISATPDVIEAAITDEAQAGNIADLHVAMARPLAPLPAVGAKISIIGTLSDYQPQPFQFMMTKAELARGIAAGRGRRLRRSAAAGLHARLPAGLRAAPRRQPQDLRQCLQACSDPEVVTQAAGACP